MCYAASSEYPQPATCGVDLVGSTGVSQMGKIIDMAATKQRGPMVEMNREVYDRISVEFKQAHGVRPVIRDFVEEAVLEKLARLPKTAGQKTSGKGKEPAA